MSAKRVLITGGSGFIGTNLVSYYLERGWQVLNIDIAEPRNREHLPYWNYIDILDRDALLQVVQSFEPGLLLHFAARTDLNEKQNLEGYNANIDGVCHVVDAVRSTPSIDRVLFTSSQLVCKLGYRPHNDHDYCPTTLYGKSKVLTEKIVHVAHDMRASWVIVRPTSLWGPWFRTPYRNFFNTIANNFYFHPGNIETLKQWGFVGNAVFQVDQLAKAPVSLVHKKTFYLADYSPTELRTFANLVQQCMGSRPIKTVPTNLLKFFALVGDIFIKVGWKNPPLTSFRYSNIITSEVQELTPLAEIAGPLPYTLEQGVEITVKWLKGHLREE